MIGNYTSHYSYWILAFCSSVQLGKCAWPETFLLIAALQNKGWKVPSRLAKGQWTTAPLSGPVFCLSNSAESPVILTWLASQVQSLRNPVEFYAVLPPFWNWCRLGHQVCTSCSSFFDVWTTPFSEWRSIWDVHISYWLYSSSRLYSWSL
jgi:hypothetical protein